MIDGASLDDYRRNKGLGPDNPIDGADHAAWLAFKVGGTDVLVHDGECFELAEDLTVSFTTQWRAPFTGGGEGVLPRGTRVRVAHEPVPEACPPDRSHDTPPSAPDVRTSQREIEPLVYPTGSGRTGQGGAQHR